MKNLFVLIIAFLSIQNIQAQSEQDLITQTLMNYIEGTSYSRIDQIEKAFYPEADLFLDNKEKTLWVVPISEYTNWFKDNKPGSFTGRIGNIISIDQFQNIATAKAEIFIPQKNLNFVDLFLLKKIEGEWKIISKTASSEQSNKSEKRILFVTSNVNFYGTSDISTGNSFSEIVEAYDTFIQAGYSVDIVSPDGGAIPLAYINTSKEIEKAYLYNSDFMYALKNTLTPKQVQPEAYKAVYYVGGGSAMFGVPENEAIQKISMSIYEENNGIVSSICHGTAGIVNLKTKDGKYLVTDKTVNGYPDAYERKDAEYFKEFPFLIQKTIEERGGNFKYAPRSTPHIESDRRVITGQNHLSSELVALKIIETIEGDVK